MPRIGVRKLLEILRQESIQIGRDKLFEILGRNGLLVRRRRTRVLTTTEFSLVEEVSKSDQGDACKLPESAMGKRHHICYNHRRFYVFVFNNRCLFKNDIRI